jgi:hypothetical protein
MRIRYIYEMADVLDKLKELANQRHPESKLASPSNPYIYDYMWAQGALRGLMEKEFHLNLIPDPFVPYIHRDAWNIGGHYPTLITRLHYQIKIPLDLQEEPVRLIFLMNEDLILEYDRGPTDFSVYGERHASNLSPQRSRMRAGGAV